MDYKIITGMSLDYYHRIGIYMIESWLRYWPTGLQLCIYTEDQLPVHHDRLQCIDLDTLGEQYHQFQSIEKMRLVARAKTFAKKAWPIMHELQQDRGRLIWVDADVITVAYIDTAWLDNLLNPGDFSAHIGAPQGSYYSVETGFFIIDLENRHREKFLHEYQRIYLERDFSDMHKPFDGDVFGKVIRNLKSTEGFKYTELNANYETALSPFNDIFNGKMKHYKAKRKNIFKQDQGL